MSVELQVLGPLRMIIDGRSVELGPERRRTVLAALAVEPGRVLSLDQLTDRVWDGSPPPGAVGSVHAYVSRLRGSMRAFDADGVELPQLLITQSPGYRLLLPAGAVDADRFADQLGRAQRCYDEGGAEALVEAGRSARAALGWWRDDPYLDIRAEFARRESSRLQELRLTAQELAVRAELGLGRHESVLPELSALVAAHPWREGLQAALLLALYRSGRQSDALAHLDRVRDQLADELGLDPGPELRRLQEQILRHDPALDLATVPVAARPGRAEAPSTPATSVVSGSRLIGRERELDRLVDPLGAVGSDLVPAAVVGEAGIGKTRLVEEAAALLTRGGVRAAWGRCWQHEGAPLLWPWIQALDELAAQLTPAELASVAGVAGIGALVPRFGGQPSAAEDTIGGSGTETARLRLYEAVRLALTSLTDRGTRVLLVLEDMHWADRDSRELAEYLVGHRSPPKVGLVITVRSPTEDSTRAGAELLNAWSRSGRAHRLDLSGWSTGAVAAYVADRTGDALDPATSSALTDRTGGNPFFVGELVRLLVTDLDDSARGSALTEAVPDSIRDVIARRIDRLPAADQTVLRVAAVVGRTFDLDLLEASAGLDPDTVDEAVDRATELGIISSANDAVGRHRFVHALTQQTLLDTTGPARRRRLHERVAAALTARRADADLSATEAEALTYHLARTGSREDLERSVDLTVAGSDLALAAGNFPEAENLLLRALDLGGRLDGDGPRETATRVRLWSLYTLIGGPGTAAAVGQHDRTLHLIRRYGGTSDVLAGHQAMLSRLSWFSDLSGIAQLVVEMDDAAEAADDDLMRAAARSARAELLTNRGELDAALAEFAVLADQAAVLRTAPPGVFPLLLEARVQAWHAIALSAAGQRDRADRVAAAAEELLSEALPTSAAYVRILLASRAVLLDDPAEVLRLASAAQQVALRHGLVEGGAFVAVQVGWARERLEPGAGLEAMASTLEATAAVPSMGHRTALWSLLADGYHRAGRDDEARTVIARARREAETTGEALFLPRIARLETQIG